MARRDAGADDSGGAASRLILSLLWFASGCGSADSARQEEKGDAGLSPDAATDSGGSFAIGSRPANPGCSAPARVPEIGSEGLPARLSQTGCFDPKAPTRPVPALIPYTVNVPLWSDGAAKDRWLALPDGARIRILPDGDFELPPGSVTIKTFTMDDRPIETRFFVRLLTGEWSGYTYEWNAEGTDAHIIEGKQRRQIGAREWHLPSRTECKMCHTQAAGHTLGLETAQLNGDMVYPGGVRANQLSTWQNLGLFDSPSPIEPARTLALPSLADTDVPVETRARTYLHANCSNCHRPEVDASGTVDFRFSTPLPAAMACGVVPLRGTAFEPEDARIIAPGEPERSMLVLRMAQLGRGRMPEIASVVVDDQGVALLSDWIRSLTTCP